MILNNNERIIIKTAARPAEDGTKTEKETKETFYDICRAIKEGGYNPTTQIVGYLISEDPDGLMGINQEKAQKAALKGQPKYRSLHYIDDDDYDVLPDAPKSHEGGKDKHIDGDIPQIKD
jgi:uncharacterized protein (UPF0297 family)